MKATGGTVYEIDFLPVENEDQDGGKSGDAIAVRFTVEAAFREAVIVIDGGVRTVERGDRVETSHRRSANT